MALIKCPDCGKEVSNRAAACIYCGCPLDCEGNVSQLKKVIIPCYKEPADEKISLIKFVRLETGLSLSEAKELVERPIPVIKDKITQNEADDLVMKLQLIGVEAAIYNSSDRVTSQMVIKRSVPSSRSKSYETAKSTIHQPIPTNEQAYSANTSYTPHHSTKKKKEKKPKKPIYKRWWFWLIIVCLVIDTIIGAIGDNTNNSFENEQEPSISQNEEEASASQYEETLNSSDNQETEIIEDMSQMWWSNTISEELANEIEAALNEIDVSYKIEGIELDETRETELFTLRIYRLSTRMYDYWIWTREWHEGEPEYNEFPSEYLTAIKNWHPDGHMGTNLWDIDGTGSEQNYKFSDTLD